MVIATDLSRCRPRYDVCIVGSGAAGLAAALECSEHGLSVLILEAGARNPSRSTLDITGADILRPTHHAPLDVGARYAFGGSTRAWGGICMAFDALDYERRDRLDLPGWPIAYAELGRFLPRAAAFLDCGFSPSWIAGNEPAGAAPELSASEARLSARPNLARTCRQTIARSKSIDLCLGITVDRIRLDAGGTRVATLALRQGSRPVAAAPGADTVVLCAGGLQTTRLLLDAQRDWPSHFAGDAVLGRYYMGHLTGEVATIVLERPVDFADYLYRRDASGRFRQLRLRVADAAQSENGLLNCSFALRAPPVGDPEHASGLLSLIHVLSKNARFRRSLTTSRLMGSEPFDVGAFARHLGLVLRRPFQTSRDALLGLTTRFVPNLPFVLPNAGGRYSLRYHAEQQPLAANRIRLTPSAKAPDNAMLEIDFQFSDADVDSVVRSHQIVDAALRQASAGRLEYWSRDTIAARIAELATDGYHQIGSTRMGTSPATSVTNPDCRVHGIDNLFLASSSVFPTSGAANPTLTIVAFAIRLADQLAARSQRVATPASTATGPSISGRTSPEPAG